MVAYQPYLTIGIILLVFAGYGAAMRAMVSAANPAQQLSNIAASLGMQIVEGDASHNVVVGPRQNILFSMFGVTKYDTRARLGGRAGPYPATFELHDKLLRVQLRRIVVHEKDEFHAELAVHDVQIPFPFEAWRPSPYGYGPEPRAGFPVVTQGASPMGPWFLASPDPRAAQWLGPMIHALAQQATHLHLIASPGKLSVPFTRTTLAGACPALPALRDHLLHIASTFAPRAPQPPQQGAWAGGGWRPG